MTDFIEEEHPLIVEEKVEEMPVDPPRGPFVEYEVTYTTRKGKLEIIEDVRGFQFDGGYYFLFIAVEGMPVPQVKVLDLSLPDIRDLQITPIRLIENNG
jgi:hypothetical protein